MRVISIETLKEKRSQGTIQEQVPFVIDGKLFMAEKKIVNGEMEVPEFSKPIGESISFGSIADLKELVGKVVLDVELGREKIPLLYKPIYDFVSDTNLPQIIDPKWALRGTVVFLEHMEGQEVKFGEMRAEKGPMARVLGYSAGFEYSKEMKEFNRTFEVEILNQSMGEAYNALLNHIHLSPIISHNYPVANKTSYQGSSNDPAWLRVWKTLAEAKKQAGTKKRQGSVLLTNSANQMNIEMALKGFSQIDGTSYPPISGIDTVIYYDGHQVQVGKKSYEYDGAATGKAYLIRPKRGFKELLKRDLQIETNKGDLTRLVENQIIGYAFRGVYAAVDENVQELTLE